MHYHLELWLPSNENVEAQVADILTPYREDNEESDIPSNERFWDWYQIGGRWTSIHNPEYDPEKDERNWEFCTLCNGSGMRTWTHHNEIARNSLFNETSDVKIEPFEKLIPCNACTTGADHTPVIPSKPGWKVKWPTAWADVEYDIMEVEKVPDDLNAFGVMVNGQLGDAYYDQLFVKHIWNGSEIVETDFDGNVKAALSKLGITTGYLVTIDYHS